MANKDELVKTINDAFEELAKEVDEQSIEYKILFDPLGPPQVDYKRPGIAEIKFSFGEK